MPVLSNHEEAVLAPAVVPLPAHIAPDPTHPEPLGPPRTADRRRRTPGQTAVLDRIGLQWVLDPSTDVVESISTYVDRAVLGWRSSR
jgi:hypothetical protein